MGFKNKYGDCYLLGRDYGMQKRYIDKDGNILLYSDYNSTLDIVVDSKTNEDLLIYKEYTNYGKVDQNYILPGTHDYTIKNFDYIEDYYIYNFYRGNGNYDGGNYRLVNKRKYYNLNGKDKILELDDVVFQMAYDKNFYYAINDEYPKMYIRDLNTNEERFIGEFKNLKVYDDKTLIFETKREYYGVGNELNDRRVGFCSANDIDNLKIYEGYNFSNAINVEGEEYYVIHYFIDSVNTMARAKYDEYYDTFECINLLDKNFNKVLKEDIKTKGKYNRFIDYKKKLEENKQSEPNEISIFDKLNINVNQIYLYIDDFLNKKEYYIIKENNGNNEYYYLINDVGKKLSEKYLYNLTLVLSNETDEHNYNFEGKRLIFVSSDENKLKNYYVLENEVFTKIEYDKTKKFVIYNDDYYSVSDWDISKLYYDKDSNYKFINEGIETITFYKIGEKFPLFSVERKVEKGEAENVDILEYNGNLYYYKETILYDTNGNAVSEKEKKDINEYLKSVKEKKENNKELYNVLNKLYETSIKGAESYDVSEDKFIDDRTIVKRKKEEIELKIGNVDESLLNKEYHYKHYNNKSDFEVIINSSEYDDWYDLLYIKNGIYLNRYIIMKHEEYGYDYAIYDIKKNKIIIEGASSISCLTDDTFEYEKGFNRGLMDFDGNIIYKYSIFTTFEEE